MARQIEVSSALLDILAELSQKTEPTDHQSVYGERVFSPELSFSGTISSQQNLPADLSSVNVAGYESIHITGRAFDRAFITIIQENADGDEVDSFTMSTSIFHKALPLRLFGTQIRFIIQPEGASSTLSIESHLSRFPCSVATRAISGMSLVDIAGHIPMWGFAQLNDTIPVVTTNLTGFPTVQGDDPNIGSGNLARVYGGDADNIAGADNGLVVNARLYLSDGTNWDRALTSGLPVTVSGAIPLTTSAFQAEASVVGSTLTTSYAALQTLAAGTKQVKFRNSCNQTIMISFDNGVTTHMTLERQIGAIDYDFGANGLSTAAQVSVRALTTIPTGGTLYMNGVS
jgi:hypothetical protein